MANTRISIRRTATANKVPLTSDIQTGELGLNMTDGVMYSSNGSVIFAIGNNLPTMHVGNSSTSLLTVGNATVNSLVVNTYISGNGFGITSVTASIVANSGIVSNATGIYANIGSGLSFVSGAITATASGGSPFGQV